MLGGRELRSSCNVGGADGVKRQQDCRTPKNSGLRRAELALSSDWDALKPLTQHFVLGQNLRRPSRPFRAALWWRASVRRTWARSLKGRTLGGCEPRETGP